MSRQPRLVESIAPVGRWHACLTALVLLVAGVGTSPAHSATATTRHEFSRVLMGTKVRVVLWCGNEGEATAAAKAALDRIAELDRVMSDWNRESELARLEAQAGRGPVPVSADLAGALATAIRFAEASDGAFDPTVAPIVRLWRTARSTGTRPDDAALAAARERVGWQRIVLADSPPTAALEAGTSLDLGAIGKGLAADEALAVLERLGFGQALVDVGGSVRAGAAPPDDDGWSIAATTDAAHFEPLRLVDAGVATSGDLEQFVEIEGIRYSHIVDPRRGSPLTTRVAVTVVASDASDADALSTAASVLEPERAKALVERFGAAAIIERGGDDGTVARMAVGTLPPGCVWPAFEAAAAAQDDAVAADGGAKRGPEAFIRARAEGRIHALELATWTMTRTGAPTVHLVGVVHIGESAFYRRLQDELAASDLVLFESVMPEAALPPHGETPEARIASTRRSLELLADLDARVRRADGAAPANLDALAAAAGRIDSRMGPVARSVAVDAWGHRVEFQADVPSAPSGSPQTADGDGPSWQLRSLGADGRPGGEGENADIEVAPLPTPTRGETDIQQELARTLGLAHQIESIDYDQPGWELADMTMEDVQAALRRRGVDAGPLLDTLAGSSFSATVAKVLLRVVQMADRLLGGQAAAMMRALMVEMLAGVDMDAIGNAGFGPGFVEVIIGDRNQAVVDALKAVIERPSPPRTVAIFYGAGHMNDLSRRLETQLGYRMASVEWIPAITVDLDQTGLSEADLAAMRRMVKGMVGK